VLQQTLFQKKEKESNHKIPDDIQLKVVGLMAQIIATNIIFKKGENSDTKSENN
jgi:hypothetical protein